MRSLWKNNLLEDSSSSNFVKEMASISSVVTSLTELMNMKPVMMTERADVT